ncbi:YhfC family intramembrane metalloprotease [Caproicibacter sp.]|uniref:YhfC family intramembrane metalloprotease n=1 Tax=Caproicibacter sp. TaxID=2814884 RepID=UPI0039895DF6
MISLSVLLAFAFAAVCTLIVPAILLFVLCLKRKISQKPMWIGAAAFFVSQICLRLPILSALGKQGWFQAFAKNNFIPYVIALAFTAGLFEEGARYLGARYLLKKQRAFRDAVAFGLGHGLCETVLLVGLTEVSNLIFCLMLNNGTLPASAPALKPAADALLAVAPYTAYMAVWERIFTVLFHVFASVLVFLGVREGKFRFWLYALAAHTLTDSVIPLLMKYGTAWAGEFAVGIVGAAGLWLVFQMRPAFQKKELTDESA